MKKRIASAIMLCLILCSLLAIAFNIQSAKADETSVTIPTGRNVTVVSGPVHLQFDFVIAAGSLTAFQTPIYPGSGENDGDIGPSTATLTILTFYGVFNVMVTAKFLGHVKVGIDYSGLVGPNDPPPTGLSQTDVSYNGQSVTGDVNNDGKVNWIDLWLITKALGSSPGSSRWNPSCDLNNDGKINIQDLSIAFQNLGKTSYWTDITTKVNTANQMIYGVTDHFSLFGVH